MEALDRGLPSSLERKRFDIALYTIQYLRVFEAVGGQGV
jgi:hypothetical protein